ncbi:MAG: metal-dependent transcriptional regulator [Proteobacteria bacterium]|nr:metal-dependent transcriptional regulator [Pseudomonadota bacterium]
MELATTSVPAPISAALEDYLETIYLLIQEHGFARVRDIARARAVKAATVSVALRKLAEGALVNYERREYIGLTPKGEDAARKVLSRHRLLTRFFEQVLRMPHEAASDQACTMEHSLTDEAMGRLVTFFESIGNCRAVVEALDRFPEGVDEGAGAGSSPCRLDRASGALGAPANLRSLAQLAPGQRAVVTQIKGGRALRQRILDMGILPDTTIALERVGDRGDPLWIRCEGAQLRLRRGEARVVQVRNEG